VDGLDAERRRVMRTSYVHRLADPEDLPGVGGVDPRDALDEHRLACAVVAHERGDLSGRDLEIDVHERVHGAEALADVAQVK